MINKIVKKELAQILRKIKADKRLAEAVVEETKKGNFADGEGKIPALKPSTIERRKRLSEVNRTGSDFSPGRSNVTFSGQLLNAVKGLVKNNATIEVFVSDSIHNQYKGIKKNRLGKPMRNREIAEHLADQGRDFVRVPKDELEAVTKDFTKELAKEITKRFGK